MGQSVNRKSCVVLLILFFIIPLLLLPGCSKEAKKERHWSKGEKYFEENKLREALIEYKNVVQLDPQDAKARYKLGMTYLRLGMFRESFAELSKAKELNPEMLEARTQLGSLFLLSRDRAKAREEADFVIAKDPVNTQGHL